MVSCKVCISRIRKMTYSLELKYADNENPTHTLLYFAPESVKAAAAYLFRQGLIGYDDDIMRVYDYKEDCFVDSPNASENFYLAYTGAQSLTRKQVLDCINKLLVAIHNKDVDGELLIELNGNLIETWRSKLYSIPPRHQEAKQKEENIIRFLCST